MPEISIQNLNNHKKEQTTILAIFIGMFIAVILTIAPGSVFIFSAVFLVGLLMWLLLPEKSEKKFVLMIFSIGFLLRIASLLSVHFAIGLSENYHRYFGTPVIAIFGDSGYYTMRSWFIARYWLGETIPQRIVEAELFSTYGWSSYLYLLSFFHYIFHFSPISSKLINCFLGTATGIIVYFIAKEVFTTKIARLSAIFTVFFPSMFLWSLSNLKDTSIIFSISIILWSFINLQKKKKIHYLIFLILALYFLARARYGFGFFMIVAVLFSYLCLSKLSLMKKIGICVVVAMGLQICLFVKNIDLKSIFLRKFSYAVAIHQGIVNTGGAVYKLLDEKYYLYNLKPTPERPGSYLYGPADMHLRDYAKMFFKGWTHFLFEPFLWKIRTRQMLFSYPQMVLWYSLTPFAFLGMLLAARHNWRLSLILLVFLFLFGTVLAMSGGNIGTNFRHRDMITPIFLLFASVGLVHICSGDFNLRLKE